MGCDTTDPDGCHKWIQGLQENSKLLQNLFQFLSVCFMIYQVYNLYQVVQALGITLTAAKESFGKYKIKWQKLSAKIEVALNMPQITPDDFQEKEWALSDLLIKLSNFIHQLKMSQLQVSISKGQLEDLQTSILGVGITSTLTAISAIMTGGTLTIVAAVFGAVSSVIVYNDAGEEIERSNDLLTSLSKLLKKAIAGNTKIRSGRTKIRDLIRNSRISY